VTYIERERGDRRQGPRRLEEVELHYAEQALVATALEVSSWREPPGSALDRLDRAADGYRAALRRLQEARRARQEAAEAAATVPGDATTSGSP
jgi:hypothetical protein